MTRRGLLALAAGVALLVLAPTAALAHPLGLPAFLRVAATDVDEVTLVWNAAPDDVAALARSLGEDVPSGVGLTPSQDAEVSRSAALVAALRDGLVVRQGGVACTAEVTVSSLATSGATMRARCPAPVDEVSIEARLLTGIDARYRTLGVVGGSGGVERWMFTADSPERTFRLDPALAGEVLAATPTATGDAPTGGGLAFGGSLPLEERFVALADGTNGATPLVLGLLVALAIGGLHGLAPGHGKAIAAAYLVGDRGRPRDAVLLGMVVALMHTGSVLVLGALLYGAVARPDTARLSAALQVASGVLVTAAGAWLLARWWVAARRGNPHRADHAHDHPHDHPHEHAHADGHAHGHGPGQHVHVLDPEVSPLSWRGLVLLGAAGGLLPSPSALLVLFTALAVGRLGVGLALIGAFSLGLATTVSVVGLAALWGRDLVLGATGRPWTRRVMRWLPVTAAVSVVGVGLLVVVRGATGLV